MVLIFPGMKNPLKQQYLTSFDLLTIDENGWEFQGWAG
jgi:hypothetical protein